jgi:hypothetical protein
MRFTDLPLLLVPMLAWALLGGGTGVIFSGEALIVGCPLACFSTVTTTHAWAWVLRGLRCQKRRALGTLCYRGVGLLYLCSVGRKNEGPHVGCTGSSRLQLRALCLVCTKPHRNVSQALDASTVQFVYRSYLCRPVTTVSWSAFNF